MVHWIEVSTSIRVRTLYVSPVSCFAFRLTVTDKTFDASLDDVSFYVGASCWEVGQLESEIDRGYFFPCSGPPEMALTGMCERFGDDDHERQRPRADLWLSMMSALGEDEANLAHLLSNGDEEFVDVEYGEACDMFS